MTTPKFIKSLGYACPSCGRNLHLLLHEDDLFSTADFLVVACQNANCENLTAKKGEWIYRGSLNSNSVHYAALRLQADIQNKMKA